MPSIFYVTLPAVWLVLVEHIIKRGKLVVSGGVTRGRVARDVIGVTTPKDMTSQAQAQKPTRTSGHTTSTRQLSSSSDRASSPSSNSASSPKSAESSVHPESEAQCESALSMKGDASVWPIALTASRSISGQKRA